MSAGRRVMLTLPIVETRSLVCACILLKRSIGVAKLHNLGQIDR